MDRELYEVCSEVLEKSPIDPELKLLHRKACRHAKKALEFEKDDERQNYERDYELELAREKLEIYGSVKDEVTKTDSEPYNEVNMKIDG